PGVTTDMQQQGLAAIASLNRRRLETLQDPEIASRIASYELAFRMQASAPELVDLAQESQATLDMYGCDRPEPKVASPRGGGPTVYKQFARNCLLAPRLVGPPQRSRQRARVLCRHGRPAPRRPDQGPQTAGPARQHAARLCRRIR